MRRILLATSLCLVLQCGHATTDGDKPDGGQSDTAAGTDTAISTDSGSHDSGGGDSGGHDSGATDSGSHDSGGGDSGVTDPDACDDASNPCVAYACYCGRCDPATDIQCVSQSWATAHPCMLECPVQDCPELATTTCTCDASTGKCSKS